MGIKGLQWKLGLATGTEVYPTASTSLKKWVQNGQHAPVSRRVWVYRHDKKLVREYEDGSHWVASGFPCVHTCFCMHKGERVPIMVAQQPLKPHFERSPLPLQSQLLGCCWRRKQPKSAPPLSHMCNNTSAYLWQSEFLILVLKYHCSWLPCLLYVGGFHAC